MKPNAARHAGRSSHWLVDLVVILAVIVAVTYWFGGAESVSGLLNWYFGALGRLVTGEPGAAAGAAFGVGSALAFGALLLLPLAVVIAIFRIAFGRHR